MHAVNGIAVEWIVTESEADDVAQEITAEGGTVTKEPEAWELPAELLDDYPDPQFEPFMVIGAVVAVGFLIKRVADVYTDLTRPGGQVIDTRSGELVVRIAPQLANGTLVIVDNEGSKVFQQSDKDEALELLGKLVGTGGHG